MRATLGRSSAKPTIASAGAHRTGNLSSRTFREGRTPKSCHDEVRGVELRCLIVAHGLEGSPEGENVQAYRAAALTVHAPDGRGQPLAVRVEQLRGLVHQHPGSILVGSSYGGLAATALVDELG